MKKLPGFEDTTSTRLCCPLCAERHNQKLVFPSNCTHEFGPAKGTLMNCPVGPWAPRFHRRTMNSGRRLDELIVIGGRC